MKRNVTDALATSVSSRKEARIRKRLVPELGASGSTDKLRLLPNIGEKLARRLHEVGVEDAEDIARIGPPALYRRLQERQQKRLPACYYLYSLEAAVRGIHWSTLSEREKRRLRRAAGLPK